MVCVEYWRGFHVDLYPPITAFAGGRGRHKRVATLATPSCLRRRARLSGKAGRQGGVAGRVGWQAEWVVSRVGWRAGSGGGEGGVAGPAHASWEPSHCRLGGVMKMSDVEATGSGGIRAEDSEARPPVAGYGTRPRCRPRCPAKQQRHLLNTEREFS